MEYRKCLVRLFVPSRFLLPNVLTMLVLASQSLTAQVIADTSRSKFAVVEPVAIDEVRWTDGFWADRLEVCHNKSVPSMWELMRDGTYKPFLEHFLIAAGQAEGDYHGAQWNDGDFYKWLEAAIATWAVTKDAELKEAIDTSIAAIAAAQRDDGYLHTPVLIRQRNGDKTAKPFENRLNFEMYNMGHLITTACLHYRSTHDRKLARRRREGGRLPHQDLFRSHARAGAELRVPLALHGGGGTLPHHGQA